MNAQAITLVLVDDHPLVLNGLQHLLSSETGFEILAACGTADEALCAVGRLHPDVLVLDLKLPDEDGLGLLRRLPPDPRLAIIVLTATQDENDLLDAVRLGARGVVLKAMAPRILEECIRAVHAGGQRLNVDGVDLARRLADRQAVELELGTVLTPRELEIVRLVAAHLDNQEIASRLSISIGTVKIHLHHVFDKLQLRGRHDLLQYLQSRRY